MQTGLSERKERILKAVVEEYTRNARPVASETLLREYGMSVSSATIRNEMAELEAEGYIYQPHTSAGRIPSERGYRYFVQRLMQEKRLPRAEQLTIRHQFHQVALIREEWLQLGAAVLARVAHAAAIVSAPQMTAARIKHFEMLQMQERMGLLVLVVQDGSVKQQLVSLPDGVNQEDLSRASNRLNSVLHAMNRAEARAVATAEPLNQTERFVVDSLLELMGQLQQRDAITVYHDGLVELLDQPEFASLERARAIVEVLERPQVLRELLPGVPQGDGIQILIGSENRWDWMKECAVVLARYGDGDEITGVVGVLGPLRLPYGIAIPSVRYIARIMTELLDEVNGAGVPAPGARAAVGREGRSRVTTEAEEAPDAVTPGAAVPEAEPQAPDGPESRSAEARELERQLEGAREQARAAESRAQENLDRWQRAQADLANFRRRTQFEREEQEKYATAGLVASLLPVLDSFDRAWGSLPGQFRHLTWLSGVAMIHSQLRVTLERIGLVEIQAAGQPFDPHLHEAVDSEGGDGPPHVVGVLQAGYTLHERVLRPALVKVGPQPAAAADAADAAETAPTDTAVAAQPAPAGPEPAPPDTPEG